MVKSSLEKNEYIAPPLWSGRFIWGSFVLNLSLKHDLASDQSTSQQPANRLQALRRERGLTRHELATSLNIHDSTLIALERASYQPSLDLSIRISQFFALPVENIFFYAQ